MTDATKILLHASYFSANFGDVLLWRTTLDLTQQAFPEAELLSANLPAGMAEVYDPKRETRALGPKENPDVTIFAGGGYFCPPGHNVLKWHVRNYLRHRRALRAAACSKKVAFLGVGFGPLGVSPMARAVGKIPAENVSVALLRDPESLKHFRDYCQARNSTTCDDLAFSYLASNTQNRQHMASDPDLLGIHMGAASGSSSHQELFLRTIAALKERKQWKLRIFVDCDNETARAGIPTLQQAAGLDCEIVVFQKSLDQFLGSIRECGMVLTTKLHVGICAAAMGVPVLSTPAHIKTFRFYRKINLEDCVVKDPAASAELAVTQRSRLLASSDILDAAASEFRSVGELLKSLRPENLSYESELEFALPPQSRPAAQ